MISGSTTNLGSVTIQNADNTSGQIFVGTITSFVSNTLGVSHV